MKTKHLTYPWGVLVAVLWFIFVMPSWAGQIKDAESATHGADASALSVVDVYSSEDFKVIQFELPVLSVYSYLLISDGEALLVDPIRDIIVYVETVEKEKAIFSPS